MHMKEIHRIKYISRPRAILTPASSWWVQLGSVALVTIGSTDTHKPVVEQRAHDKYPIQKYKNVWNIIQYYMKSVRKGLDHKTLSMQKIYTIIMFKSTDFTK